jgi:hypothetical protein
MRCRFHSMGVEFVQQLCYLIRDSYNALVAACKATWDFSINDPERIRSIGSRGLGVRRLLGGSV